MARSPKYYPRHPALRFQDETVRVAVQKSAQLLAPVAHQSPPVAQLHTEPLVDGDTILTVHPALYDIDEYDDPTAIYYAE